MPPADRHRAARLRFDLLEAVGGRGGVRSALGCRAGRPRARPGAAGITAQRSRWPPSGRHQSLAQGHRCQHAARLANADVRPSRKRQRPRAGLHTAVNDGAGSGRGPSLTRLVPAIGRHAAGSRAGRTACAKCSRIAARPGQRARRAAISRTRRARCGTSAATANRRPSRPDANSGSPCVGCARDAASGWWRGHRCWSAR